LEGPPDSALLTARPMRPADALARLAAGAAHELNNPLSVMVGYLSLIASGQTPEAQLKVQLQHVATEAQQCRVVLRGLTELAECTLAEPEPLELSGVLADARAALGDRTPMAVSIVGDARGTLIGQARGLTSLVSHGLRNAVEASARSVTMTLTHARGVTRLELRDDGAGMPEQVLARAREPFFSTRQGHLGLGLAICDAVAWSHGGWLELSSGEKRGTTLTLALPTGPKAEGAA
jgi:two-component system, NtrC family, sensor kinase